MTYKVLDIARYVINFSQYIDCPTTNLKLQKLLYYIQGYFLALKNKPCFEEEIEAWAYGPVIPIVYHEFKEYGSNYIPFIKVYFEYNEQERNQSQFKNFEWSIISEEDQVLIDLIVETLKDTSTTSLVNMTHAQNGPWQQVYISGKKNIIIEKERIKDYFFERYLKNE